MKALFHMYSYILMFRTVSIFLTPWLSVGKVLRPRVAETTALGAAFAAGLAVGVWSDCAELSRTWVVQDEYISEMAADEREAVRKTTSQERGSLYTPLQLVVRTEHDVMSLVVLYGQVVVRS